MTTLTDFLLARIAETKAIARAAQEDAWAEGAPIGGWDDPWPSHLAFAEHLTPARVLAECEAKRRIVASAQELVTHGNDAARAISSDILHDLAQPYADHPECREEFKP